jgi:hypothetical protein
MQRITSNRNSYFLLRQERTLQQSAGFKESKYQGSQDKLYARFRSSQANLYSLGFAMEKDAGEKIMWSPRNSTYGADFLSGHFALFNKGIVKAMIVGDYQLQFGQGLVLGSGFKLGKGGEPVVSTVRNDLGIRPYTSVLESGFMRGAAATLGLRKFDLTSFYSRNSLDASLNTGDTVDRQERVATIQFSGYHRTPQELEHKFNLMQSVIGQQLYYRFNRNIRFGASFLHMRYDKYQQKTPNSYNRYDFVGKENNVGSIYYQILLKNFNFFSEAALSKSGGYGVINGFIASLSPTVDLALNYRNYSKGFHSPFGMAFGENVNNQNERGLYSGIKIRLGHKWTVSGFYDHFEFPWLKYRVDAPSQGYEYQARLAFKPGRTTLLYCQYNSQHKMLNYRNEAAKMNAVLPNERTNVMLSAEYSSKAGLKIKSRIQSTDYYHEDRSLGYVIFQEIGWERRSIELTGRVALFDTDDYNSRQYVYERDVLYAFSIPALFGKGIRSYFLLQWKIRRDVDLFIKYAHTRLLNQDKIGSGNDEIEGNEKSTIKSQLMFRF